MATPLDVGLLQNFQIIFPFLLVLVVIFAFLQYAKIFGTNKSIHAFFALVIALLVLMSPTIRQIINLMSPWFVLLFIFIMFILMAFKIFGTSDSQIMGAMKTNSSIIWWVIALCLIIGIGSITYVLSEKGTFEEGPGGEPIEKTSDTEQSDFWSTLFHPKVLGLALIFLIGMFTIQRLAAK